ncbi:MAG: T9SS type A sorting domain-containing protein [Nonlabens sp.]
MAIAASHQLSTPLGAQFYANQSGSQESLVVRFDAATGGVLGIDPIPGAVGSGDGATAIAADAHGNYAVGGGGFFENQLFTGAAGVAPLATRPDGGDTDFWYASLNRTDCNGVPLGRGDVAPVPSPRLVPNPSSHGVRVSNGVPGSTYAVYGTSGRLVGGGVLNTSLDLGMEHLATGIYLVRIEQPGVGARVLKMVRE